MTVRVIIVDDHTSVRQALASLVDGQAQFTVVAQAGDLRQARETLAGQDADVLLVDVSLPDGDGLDLVAEVRGRSATTGIVVLTMHEDDATVVRALHAGASALVHKSAPAERVMTAIAMAATSPTTFVADNLAGALRRDANRVQLTPREQEVMEQLAHGASVAQAGRALHMSDGTVKTHIGKIYGKLGVNNRAGAVMAALKLGLIEPPPDA